MQAGARVVAVSSSVLANLTCVKQGWVDAASISSSPCAINMFSCKHLHAWSWRLAPQPTLKTCCSQQLEAQLFLALSALLCVLCLVCQELHMPPGRWVHSDGPWGLSLEAYP